MNTYKFTPPNSLSQIWWYEVAPIVTFGQLLSWKAVTIMHNEQQDSELHVWKIYADTTLIHMVSGKAYARATKVICKEQ